MNDSIGTSHAELRLMQRTGDLDTTLSEAWDEGIPCEVEGHGYEEARVNPSHDVALLMQNGKIITVLDDTSQVSIDWQYLQEYLSKGSTESLTESFL